MLRVETDCSFAHTLLHGRIEGIEGIRPEEAFLKVREAIAIRIMRGIRCIIGIERGIRVELPPFVVVRGARARTPRFPLTEETGKVSRIVDT